MGKFYVGDKVRVVNNGNTYTLYDYAARQLKLTNWRAKFTPNNHEVGTIISAWCDERELYGVKIDSTGEEYVMGEEGLELYNGEYTLQLTLEEARTLLVLTGNVIGGSLDSPRKHCDSVYGRLEILLGFGDWDSPSDTPEGKLFSTNNDWDGNYIHFDNYPDLEKQRRIKELEESIEKANYELEIANKELQQLKGTK